MILNAYFIPPRTKERIKRMIVVCGGTNNQELKIKNNSLTSNYNLLYHFF